MIPPHDHCPLACEHPQPFTVASVQRETAVLPEGMRAGGTYCGRCWFACGRTVTEMVPCTPATCPDAAPASSKAAGRA